MKRSDRFLPAMCCIRACDQASAYRFTACVPAAQGAAAGDDADPLWMDLALTLCETHKGSPDVALVLASPTLRQRIHAAARRQGLAEPDLDAAEITMVPF